MATAFRTIVVGLDGNPRGTEVLAVAANIARRFEAHLAALFTTQPPMLAGAAMEPAAMAVALEYQLDSERTLERQARAQIAAVESAQGIAIEWRSSRYDAVNNLALHARHADLLIMSQEDPELSIGIGPSLPAGVVLAAGRPVLLVPYVGHYPRCGESVLIAWNGGREATRAIGDALPLLKRAREVHLVAFNPRANSGWGEIPGADIATWLARHDVNVTVHETRSSDIDVGNQLLSLAADFDSDLIVMGAYGHSRAYEVVLGGVTRTVLKTMTVPVLLSH